MLATSTAKAKWVRISWRKVGLVLALIKGKTVDKANAILEATNKRATVPVRKVIMSAFANINHDRQEKLLEKEVVVKTIKADDGPMLKRYRAATMGRATPIRHRTAHISVQLEAVEKIEKTEKNEKTEKADKAENTVKKPLKAVGTTKKSEKK
ncbi:MAG: 50S ribosomal protein L22 [Candidatus Omnitrophica bacterium]|nr:50S ribosomal protein L22 [Candidatus Omnitrophota bacterium]